MMPRVPRLQQLAWVGVMFFGVGITALGIWSSWYTLTAIDETRRIVTLNDGWKQAQFWIAEEETLERKYRIERIHNDGFYHEKVVKLLDGVVEHMRPLSTPADNVRIDALIAANERYRQAMHALFRGIDAGDERRVEAIHDAIDPTYDAIEHIANAQESIYHRGAYLALARLEKTQRYVATGFPIFATFGLITIFACIRIIRDYRRRTDKIIAEQFHRLEQAALIDALTGVKNSRAFQAMIDGSVDDPTAQLHLALIDVDRFKLANDRFGHLHGDNVLRVLGTILRELPLSVTAYRIGGDEFAVVFDGGSATQIQAELSALQQQCGARMRGNTLSIGVASLDPSDRCIVALRERADIALYEAKHRGRNRVVTFDPQLLETSTSLGARRLALDRVLANPIGIAIVFQPIWEFATGTLLGYEALSRFASDFATPDEAFAVAERLDRAHELDDRCIAAVGAHLPANFSGSLFVNMSPTTLLHGDVAERALTELARVTQLPPRRIVVELTEHIPIAEQGIEQVCALRVRGFRFALDDTGSGNAGLAILAQLPVDIVKIDKSLLNALDEDQRSTAIVSGILVMVKGLGCGVIVEGIETRDHIRRCRELALAHGVVRQLALQGYGLGRPCAPGSIGVATNHPALRHTECAALEHDRRADVPARP